MPTTNVNQLIPQFLTYFLRQEKTQHVALKNKKTAQEKPPEPLEIETK